VRQAETQKQAADGAVTARLPEAYQWRLVPEQVNPQAPITWPAIRLTGRDAGRIAEEVIAHIAGLTGSQVTVTLEIEATVPDGAPEQVVRIVTENSRTLRFTSHGFETE
jgi:hypothetical protein